MINDEQDKKEMRLMVAMVVLHGLLTSNRQFATSDEFCDLAFEFSNLMLEKELRYHDAP